MMLRYESLHECVKDFILEKLINLLRQHAVVRDEVHRDTVDQVTAENIVQENYPIVVLLAERLGSIQPDDPRLCYRTLDCWLGGKVYECLWWPWVQRSFGPYAGIKDI